MHSRSDVELVAAVLSGDVDAFAALAGRYRDTYVRFATRMLGSRADADDVLQSAFMRAYRKLGACREPEQFNAWLSRIVVNECRTFASRRQRRERRFVDAEDVLEQVLAESPSAGDDTMEEVQRALARLVPEHREAFLLKHVEELSYEEIAELTGVGVSALKMRVKRACERLRELLEGAQYV